MNFPFSSSVPSSSPASSSPIPSSSAPLPPTPLKNQEGSVKVESKARLLKEKALCL